MPNLSDASNVYVGSQLASKVYLGSTEIWTGGGGGGGSTPTAKYYFDSEGATDGTYLTTADSYGSYSFDSINTADQIQFATSSAKNGGMGLAILNNTSTGSAQWNNSTSEALHSVGLWFKPATTGSADHRVFDLRETSSAGTVGGVIWTASGVFRIMVGSSGTAPGQSPVMTTGVWYWVSFTWDCTNKKAHMRIYDDTGSLVHDSTEQSITSTYNSLTTFRVGRTLSVNIGASSYDDIQWDPGSLAVLSPWLAV